LIGLAFQADRRTGWRMAFQTLAEIDAVVARRA
jgi:hypothetical protein